MNHAGFRRLLLSMLVFLLLALVAQASEPLPLRGWYQLTDARTESEQTTLRLHLMLFNLEDSELQGVKLALTSTVTLGRRLASIPAVSIPAFDRREIEIAIEVSARDYEAWLLGAAPRVHLVDSGEDGLPWLRRIDLERRDFVERPDPGASGAAIEIERIRTGGESTP